jgi:hypothetical protein
VEPTTITPDANGKYPSVMHYGALPPNSLVGSINGLLSGVLAYAAASLAKTNLYVETQSLI